jgi:hypothetical protein
VSETSADTTCAKQACLSPDILQLQDGKNIRHVLNPLQAHLPRSEIILEPDCDVIRQILPGDISLKDFLEIRSIRLSGAFNVFFAYISVSCSLQSV